MDCRFVRSMRVLGVASGVLALFATAGRATQPDRATVACLTSVVRSSPNAVSVNAANDWVVQFGKYRVVRKGIEFTFRKSDGTAQTVEVYVQTDFKIQLPSGDAPMAIGGVAVPVNNGRYEVILRPPYPDNWYPPAQRVFDPPNGTKLIRRDSKEHPLYRLWGELASRCRIYNDNLNSKEVP